MEKNHSHTIRIVCQTPGDEPYTICAYSGEDLSQVLGITQADSMHEGSYGWIQECGEAVVRVSGQTQAAYADFRPNAAKLNLSTESSNSSQKRPTELTSGTLDDNSLAHHRCERLSRLGSCQVK